ncbi:hypothetical protein AMJ87_13445 [candidate division WOR_3 bacterium SM23_60]|uniref:Probable endolytic peptidoglycan transglycosylase RlpA n=1 Tax=candidate division WOR_3 bacterium SM23_60 TaxID=1703780 RepID=A0A0S8G353_UNCW3|nr:MAG: hypothetical protein AMJ87_13445 [candidate division WOR_3 bacterium SM23_60]
MNRTWLLCSIAIVYCCCASAMQHGGYVAYGMASYYSDNFHGRATASGETYDRYAFTCAHRTLPFGTRLVVTNLANRKSVFVRVNDRGPFVKGRIIDLSYAAAEEIGMIGAGVVKVKVEETR